MQIPAKPYFFVCQHNFILSRPTGGKNGTDKYELTITLPYTINKCFRLILDAEDKIVRQAF